MAISFKGAHFPPEVILMGVCWYLAYPLSTRHVEELMEERRRIEVILTQRETTITELNQTIKSLEATNNELETTVDSLQDKLEVLKDVKAQLVGA